jgi:hypothetical protein
MDQEKALDQTNIPKQNNPLQKEELVTHLPHKKNIYPSLRHIILTSFILMCMALILFLMHQNGKSIYDNGL